MTTTHYAPAFTRIKGVRQQAACGLFILPSQHSAEPGCPVCQAYVLQEADLDHAMEETAAEPFDSAGASRHREFNPTAGYRPIKESSR